MLHMTWRRIRNELSRAGGVLTLHRWTELLSPLISVGHDNTTRTW
jgi:hypothetical protein